jgi:triacylglycerol lipase
MRFLLLLAFSLTACTVGNGGPTSDDFAGDDGDDDDESIGLLPPGKIAIVLAHGLGGNPDSFDPAIVAAIEANGHAVLRTAVPGVDSVAVRAAALVPQIDPFLVETGAAQVHIIAHSMGGLDARHAISSLGLADRVASLTTVSSPHHGTPLADAALGLTANAGAQADALAALADLVGVDVDPEALDRALADLTEAAAPAFNAANPDVATVLYTSYAGFSTPGGIDNPNAAAVCATATMPVPAPDTIRPLLVLPAPIVAGGLDRRPNDGVVPVDSATWTGFAGCIPADHLDETGTPAAIAPPLDVVAFYRDLAEQLAL